MPLQRVKRYDQGVPAVVAGRTPDGFLKLNGRLTRVGVFVYTLDDGTKRRELRVPEEVFKPESLASFQMLPVCDEHPPVPVTPQNIRQYQRGNVGDSVTRDGDYMVAPLIVNDADLASRVESGEQVEVSNGYACDWDPTPGTHPLYGPFDGYQRNIVGNHVALVRRGRAGPTVRVRLDAGDAFEVASAEMPGANRGIKTMDKVQVTINGVTYMADPQLAQAIQVALQQSADEMTEAQDAAKAAQQQAAQAQQGATAANSAAEAAKAGEAAAKADSAKANARADAAEKLAAEKTAEAEKEKARADAADEAAKKAEKARTDALEPGNMAKLVDARATLQNQASVVLGKGFKTDGLSDHDIKVAVLKKRLPDLDLKDRPAAYIDARFDGVMEVVAKENPAALKLRADAITPPPAPGAGPVIDDPVAAAHDRMTKHHQDAWKPKT